MNILSADHKPLCSEGAQARPRILSTRTQCLDSQPHSCCITLSPPLTYGELLTSVPKSMVTWPGPGQSVCSILPGHRDWLGTGEVTNQGPGPGLMQESRGRGFLVLPEGVGPGNVRIQKWEGREVGRGGLVAFLLQSWQSRRLWTRALLSTSSCWGPGARPETWEKSSACDYSSACLSACLNHAGFSVQRAKWRPWKCNCVGFGWLQRRNARWHWRLQLIWIQVISLESEVKAPQSCPTLCNPLDYMVHGFL